MMVGEKIRDQRNKKKIGYSLIEALVALGILLLGIVPVVTVATQAILFHHRASETEEAARISQTMIDYIKSRGYDGLKNIPSLPFIGKYALKSTSEGAFTIDKNASGFNDFGLQFDIDDDLILLNSKGIDLNGVNFYIVMDNVKGSLKKSDKITDDTYEKYPVTGEIDRNDVYTDDLIYGQFIFGMGKVTKITNKKSGREKELKTTFIITPIENWK